MYPNWYFWFENKPSGNPEFGSRTLRPKVFLYPLDKKYLETHHVLKDGLRRDRVTRRARERIAQSLAQPIFCHN
jgi:hypothetical protein